MVKILIAAFLASAAFAPIGIWYLAVLGYSLFFRKISKYGKFAFIILY
jgi:apolipoprotein N-acyltransferase